MQQLTTFYRNHTVLIGLMILFLGYIGRGVQNTLLSLNFLLALLVILDVFYRQKSTLTLSRSSKILIFSWLLMYLLWLVSGQVNGVLSVGLTHWLVSFLSSSIVLFVIILQRTEYLQASLQSHWVLSGLVIALSYFFWLALSCYFDDGCKAAFDFPVMSIPIIYPFMALFFKKRVGWISGLNLLAIPFFVILWFAESRTEIVMFVTMLAVLNLMYYRVVRYAILLPALLIVILFVYFTIERHFDYASMDTFSAINLFTSYRLEIWWHALSHLPDNIFFGSGIDNTDSFLPPYRFSSALHNAYLEILYETGLIGIVFFLLLNVMFIKHLRAVYIAKDDFFRNVYIQFFASYVALLIAGFLDKGQMSFYFKYVFYLLGASLFLLGERFVSDQKNNCIQHPPNPSG